MSDSDTHPSALQNDDASTQPVGRGVAMSTLPGRHVAPMGVTNADLVHVRSDGTTIVGWASGLIKSNPYFSAGAGLYCLTMAGMIGRYGMLMVGAALKRRYVVSLETTNKDASYTWLLQWLSRHQSFRYQQMSAITSELTIHANEQISSQCTFAPCPNVQHLMWFQGRPILVVRKRQADRAMGSEVLETLELTTIGRSGAVMMTIMNEARDQAMLRDSDKTVIYHNAGGRWSRQQDPRSRRPLHSVLLSGTKREDLVADVRQFLASKEYYMRLGVPYRRGYLLHGPPGCGKSSVVTALAGELRLAICVLSLSNRGLDDESLNTLLNGSPMRSIILLEDIDRAFTSESRVTMSGLLNALDGVAAQEGRLVFMTTNHVDKLDPALIRAGRADVKMEIGLLDEGQVDAMFLKFFPDCGSKELVGMREALSSKKVSAAQLQSLLFLHRNDPVAAVAAAKPFVEEITAFDKAVARQRELREELDSRPPPPMMAFRNMGRPPPQQQ